MAPAKKKKSKKAKSFLGMPMSWDKSRILTDFWNEKERKIVVPKGFGIGWTINLHALFKKVGLIK